LKAKSLAGEDISAAVSEEAVEDKYSEIKYFPNGGGDGGDNGDGSGGGSGNVSSGGSGSGGGCDASGAAFLGALAVLSLAGAIRKYRGKK
jgi:hypothetical protein